MPDPAPPLHELPNHAYYRACEGTWAGPLDLVVTDWAAFRRSPMRLADRLGLMSLLATARMLGAFRVETSVDYRSGAARGVVVHTTDVTKWGAKILSSVETLRLDPNGRDVTMAAEMRLASAPWRTIRFADAPASVDASGTTASYRFPWLGVEMRQRGERSADGTTVILTQETSFLRGVQVLRRVTGTRAR